MSNQSTAHPAHADDTFCAHQHREATIARLLNEGFSPKQAERLLFLVWLDTKHDLEQVDIRPCTCGHARYNHRANGRGECVLFLCRCSRFVVEG